MLRVLGDREVNGLVNLETKSPFNGLKNLDQNEEV